MVPYQGGQTCHPQHKRLVNEFRQRIFEEVATSDLSGLIFTCVWNLESSHTKALIDSYTAIFQAAGWQTYFVELAADQQERVRRNKSSFRLEQKPSKRNTTGAEKYLFKVDQSKKLNSDGDFYYTERYIKIDNTTLSPEATAQRIVDTFGFQPIA